MKEDKILKEFFDGGNVKKRFVWELEDFVPNQVEAIQLALKWRNEALVDYNEARGSIVLKPSVVFKAETKKKKEEKIEEGDE